MLPPKDGRHLRGQEHLARTVQACGMQAGCLWASTAQLSHVLLEGGKGEPSWSDPHTPDCPESAGPVLPGRAGRYRLEILHGATSVPGGYDLIHGSSGVVPAAGAGQIPATPFPAAVVRWLGAWRSG